MTTQPLPSEPCKNSHAATATREPRPVRRAPRAPRNRFRRLETEAQTKVRGCRSRVRCGVTSGPVPSLAINLRRSTTEHICNTFARDLQGICKTRQPVWQDSSIGSCRALCFGIAAWRETLARFFTPSMRPQLHYKYACESGRSLRLGKWYVGL